MPDELKVNQSVIRLTTGFIIDLNVDAFVHYARADLVLGSGYGGAIATKGGPKIQEELKKLGPVKTTDVVMTSGGNLKAKYILHAVGPRFQEENLEDKLRTTTLNALRKAEESDIQSLALPAMGAGFYGVPLEVCARVTLEAVKKYLESSKSLREVIFCLRDSQEYKAFQEQMKKIQPGGKG
jgi:O-acetyl-ADP-ribose deacetylase (regulator of RNase III)